jgi:cytochrome P450
MRARARADAIVFEEITRRRSERTDEGDLLSALIAAQDSDGTALSDQELRDQVVSLIAAGYETTSALVAWALYEALRDDGLEEAIRDELDVVFGGDRVSEERLDHCRTLGALIQETLRLHSPAGFSGRMAQADIDFGGHTIKAGTLVIYSQYVTHRLPEIWPEPERFRPERWISDDASLVEPEPYTFLPFGGGYRRCIGFAMATLEAQLVVAHVIRHSRLQLQGDDIEGHGLATFAPRGGVPVTVAE